MNSKEIAVWIGRRSLLRKLGFQLIHYTTLREWYIKKGLKQFCGSLNASPRILDAGCGLGQHLYFCARRQPHAKVVGLENDPQLVADLRDFLRQQKVDNAAVAAADLAACQIDDQYDVVLCASVLEHIPQDQLVLNKLAACLQPGGYLLIYVPSAEKRVLTCLEKKIQRMLRETGRPFLHDHVRYYSPQDLAERVRSAGLRVVQKRITYGRFGRWAYDLVTMVQFSRFFLWLFPWYLLLIHPWVLVLMALDTISENQEGNGLWMVTVKPVVA